MKRIFFLYLAVFGTSWGGFGQSSDLPYGVITITSNGVSPQHLDVYQETAVSFVNETWSDKTYKIMAAKTNQFTVLSDGGLVNIGLKANGMENPGSYRFERIYDGPPKANSNLFSGTIRVHSCPYPDLKLRYGEVLTLEGIHHFRTVEMADYSRLQLAGDTTIIVWGPIFGHPNPPTVLTWFNMSSERAAIVGDGENGRVGSYGTTSTNYGASGSSGGPGQPGGRAHNLTLIVHGIATINDISLRGGGGGSGGPGGHGNYGEGFLDVPGMEDKLGKDGGNGGNGGHGAPGAAGGHVKILATDGLILHGNIVVGGGAGGSGGGGGVGFLGGLSGENLLDNDDPDDNRGKTGSPGLSGQGAPGGDAGSIELLTSAFYDEPIMGKCIAAGGAGGDSFFGIGPPGGRGGNIRVLCPERVASYVYDRRGFYAPGGAGGAGGDALPPSDPAPVDGKPGFPGGSGNSGGTITLETSSFRGYVSAPGGGGGGGGHGSSGRLVSFTSTNKASAKGGPGGAGGSGGSGGVITVKAVNFLPHEFPQFDLTSAPGGDGGGAGSGFVYDHSKSNWVEILAPFGMDGLPGSPAMLITNLVPADLGVELSVNTERAKAGEKLTYSVLARSLTDQTNAQITLSVPAGTTFFQATPGAIVTGPEVKWVYLSGFTGLKEVSLTVQTWDKGLHEMWVTNQAQISSRKHLTPLFSDPVVTRVERPTLQIGLAAFEIAGTGQRLGPIRQALPGALIEWETVVINLSSNSLTLDRIDAPLPTNTEFEPDSLSPAGMMENRQLSWSGPISLAAGQSQAFRFRSRVVKPLPAGQEEARFEGVTVQYTQGGASATKSSGTLSVNLSSKSIALSASPEKISADGEDTSQITALVTNNGQPVSGVLVRFETTRGGFVTLMGRLDYLTALTDPSGHATVKLQSDTESGHALVRAKWDLIEESVLVQFIQYKLSLEPLEVRYTRVPAIQFGETVTATVPVQSGKDANVTVYGRNEVALKIKLSAPNAAKDVAFQTINIASPEKNLVGPGFIHFLTNMVTDAQGEAILKMGVDDLWQIEPSFDSITINISLGADESITAGSRVFIRNNLGDVLDYYLMKIPRGVIWVHPAWDKLRAVSPALADSIETNLQVPSLAGDLNNVLDAYFYLFAEPSLKTVFAETTCGGYQAQVLNLLQRLRFDLTGEGQTDWWLNGLDYGPIFELGGFHVAALIYPRVTDGREDWRLPHTRILDPWLEQEARFYTWPEWLKRLSNKSFRLTDELVENFLISTKSMLQPQYNVIYPVNGCDYPNNKVTPPHPPKKNKTTVLVNCPVLVTIQDAQGRRTGYIPDAPPGTPPMVDEIPGVQRSFVQAAEGTNSWLFELPQEPLTMTIHAYEPGAVDLLSIGPAAILAFSKVPFQTNNPATFTLNPQSGDTPRLRFADGNLVPPAIEILDLPVSLELNRVAGDLVEIQFYARTGSRYALEASTDMRNWTSIVTNLTADGLWRHGDSPTPLARHRFYRARHLNAP